MQWRTIKDFKDYKVSETGQVFSIKRNKVLKPYEKKNYLGVYLYQNNVRKFMTIHRLVALAFIDNPNNYPQINHKDENTKNNCVENLEWCSAKYNANYGNHNKRLSIAKSGINNPFYGRKHTEETKNKMRNLKLGKNSNNCKKIIVNGKEYNSMTECSKNLGISLTHLHNIINGKRKNILNLEVLYNG